MKRIARTLLLLLSVTGLVNAAALERNHEVPLPTSFDDLPKEIREDIIKRGLPELIQFIIRCSTDKHRFQIEVPATPPERGWVDYLFTMSSPTNGKLVIIPQSTTFNFSGVNHCGEMIIWDLQKNKLLHHIKRILPLQNAYMTPDGKKIIACDYNHIVSVWDADSGRKLWDLGSCDCGMAINRARSRLVIFFGSEATVWNTETGERVNRFMVYHGFGGILKVVINDGGTKIAVAGCDHPRNAYQRISPDSINIHIIDVITGNELREIHPERASGVISLDFNSDNKRLSGCFRTNDRNIGFEWDVNTGQRLVCFDHIRSSNVYSLGDKTVQYDEHFVPNYYDISIFDNTSHMIGVMHGHPSSSPIMNSHWFVNFDVDAQRVCVYNLNEISHFSKELYRSLCSLSCWQIILLELIRNEAEQDNKLLLDGEDPEAALKIAVFKSLPRSIKECMNDHVILLNASYR